MRLAAVVSDISRFALRVVNRLSSSYGQSRLRRYEGVSACGFVLNWCHGRSYCAFSLLKMIPISTASL